MAYIKHRAIHVTPKANLKYILDPGKNEEMKYSTAICCTNDFEAVCPFDVYGNRWLANKKTYQLAREVSDRICLEHGLSIIKNPKRNKSLSYAE